MPKPEKPISYSQITGDTTPPNPIRMMEGAPVGLNVLFLPQDDRRKLGLVSSLADNPYREAVALVVDGKGEIVFSHVVPREAIDKASETTPDRTEARMQAALELLSSSGVLEPLSNPV